MPEQTGPSHRYHAEAGVLHAKLQLPLAQVIKPQAFVKLPENGGYLSQHAHDYQLEGVVSFKSAYTQVAGNPDVKPGHGFTTVATSVIEGLNILDVVTADKIVAQVSTEHPLKGYVPQVKFLGTRFENLRIAGHAVKLDLDHDFLGARHPDGLGYNAIKDLMERIAGQVKCLEGVEPFPDDELAEFDEEPISLGDDPEVDPNRKPETIEGSLVKGCKVEVDDDNYPGKCAGNVIEIPDFGSIHLAALHVEHRGFHKETGVPKQTIVNLKMMKVKMGCLAAGATAIGSTRNNGSTDPGSGGGG